MALTCINEQKVSCYAYIPSIAFVAFVDLAIVRFIVLSLDKSPMGLRKKFNIIFYTNIIHLNPNMTELNIFEIKIYSLFV
jgi:hypothetical protein